MMGKIAIIPSGLNEGDNIVDKFYHQLTMLNLLAGAHPFFPPVEFEMFDLTKIKRYRTVPAIWSDEDLELLLLYEKEEREKIMPLISGEEAAAGDIISSLFQKDIIPTLPLPVFSEQKIIKYPEINSCLQENNYWILQLLSFFEFLTDEKLLLSNKISPSDFIYTEKGQVKYFLGFSYLSFTHLSPAKIVLSNMRTLACLLEKYYMKDISLYRQRWFEKITGRLIKPMLYGKKTATKYSDFKEIISDIQDSSQDQNHRSLQVGVFLDMANFFAGLGNLRVNFDRLFSELYPDRNYNIYLKKAVMFVPYYQDDEKGEDVLEKLYAGREYLIERGFDVVEVENDSARAKSYRNKREYDIDDQKLISIMKENITRIDSAVLMTGDSHFKGIIDYYRHRGKDVKIISLTAASTCREFIADDNHQFIYDNWQCIEY